MSWFALALATAGGAGLAPVAPGTFGSAVGVGLFIWIAPSGGIALGAAAGLLFSLGTWASDEAERWFAQEDDGRIVIDEVAGQLLALTPLAAFPAASQYMRSPGWLVVGFALFRLFDIWKPGPVRWAERRFPGGLGVMADDGVAGLLAALVLAVLLISWESLT